MLATKTLTEEILDLKQDRRAILLAHHYQEPEIQELADWVGDSLELARKARDFEGDVIAFCGVWFMAETAKVLNPSRVVVVPDRAASCSLVDSCPVEPIRNYRRLHPDHVIVSYINTSVEVKAESDILCTSRNAVQIVNSVAADKTILFLPDQNLGGYVQKQTGRKNMKIWQGTCIVHATFPARRLAAARADHPDALVVAHPECPPAILEMADFIGSTSAIMVRALVGPRVHRDDGERRSAFAPQAGAGKNVPLRGQRKLQLQRVSLHAYEHSRKAPRRAGEPGTASRTQR